MRREKYLCRVTFKNEEDAYAAEQWLDKGNCNYKYDSHNRMVLRQADLAWLEASGIDFDEV